MPTFRPAAEPPAVWIVALPPRLTSRQLTACVAVLDEGERLRAANFKVEPAREQFIAAHAVLRSLLSTFVPVAPVDWRFAPGRFGKPTLVAPDHLPSLQFNLSHTDRLIAAAASMDGPIGVDVESLAREIDVEHFRNSLSDAERSDLAALDGIHRRTRFYALWTAKEAVVKAVGTGISAAMGRIEIVTTGSNAISRSPDADYDGWAITRAQSDTHFTTVATRGRATVTFRFDSLDEYLASFNV